MSESDGGPALEGIAGSSTIDSEERGKEDSPMVAFEEPLDEEWNEILPTSSQKSPQERASGRNEAQVKGDGREIKGLGSGCGKGNDVAETDELAGPDSAESSDEDRCLKCSNLKFKFSNGNVAICQLPKQLLSYSVVLYCWGW